MRTDPGFRELRTERLLLRRSQPGDAEAISAYRSDPVVHQHQGWARTDPEHVRQEIEEMLRRTPGEPGTFRGLRFGVSGDWRGELSPYPALQNAAERDLDFFVELGDTIYADYPSPAVPADQARTLAEFRAKHSEVYSARFGLNAWAELRSSTPVWAVTRVTFFPSGGLMLRRMEHSRANFTGKSGSWLSSSSRRFIVPPFRHPCQEWRRSAQNEPSLGNVRQMPGVGLWGGLNRGLYDLFGVRVRLAAANRCSPSGET